MRKIEQGPLAASEPNVCAHRKPFVLSSTSHRERQNIPHCVVGVRGEPTFDRGPSIFRLIHIEELKHMLSYAEHRRRVALDLAWPLSTRRTTISSKLTIGWSGDQGCVRATHMPQAWTNMDTSERLEMKNLLSTSHQHDEP